jgi:hypothetical protein
MAAVGLWKRKEIDQCEASIYRKILGLPNNITNRAILNTMTSMKLAGEAITRLIKKYVGTIQETESTNTIL